MSQPDHRWPPPGLERMQGDLQRIATRAALAGLLLVLPILYFVGRDQDVSALNPLADAWFIVTLFGAVGLGFAVDTIVWCMRTLRRTGHALDRGYDTTTVARVLVDGARDMGFLAAGARHFSVLDARSRDEIATIRITASMLLAVAGVWMLVWLPIALFFSARGRMDAATLQVTTLLPAGLAYVCGGLAVMIQEGRVRRARRAWHAQPWAEDLASDEIRTWQESAGVGPSRVSGRLVSRAGFAAGIASLVIVLPVMTLVPATAVAPILSAIATPDFSGLRSRAAAMEAFRGYRLPGDPSISSTDAGIALQRLAWGDPGREPAPGERPLAGPASREWPLEMEGPDNPFRLADVWWADSLFSMARATLGSEQRAFVSELEAHPLAADFGVLARAPGLDAAAARWTDPLPEGLTAAQIPIPRYRSLRAAANARVAAAAVAAADGRFAEAERRIREVISAGFLLMDDGVLLLDNAVGVVLVEVGAKALAELYLTTDRRDALEELTRVRTAVEGSALRLAVSSNARADGSVERLEAMTLDTTRLRGLRWEHFLLLATNAPCMSLNRVVFGMSDEYDDFLARAREALVAYPSENGLFDVAQYGFIGAPRSEPMSLGGRLLTVYMNREESSCARYVEHLRLFEQMAAVN